jgi:hypothetical protein
LRLRTAWGERNSFDHALGGCFRKNESLVVPELGGDLTMAIGAEPSKVGALVRTSSSDGEDVVTVRGLDGAAW